MRKELALVGNFSRNDHDRVCPDSAAGLTRRLVGTGPVQHYSSLFNRLDCAFVQDGFKKPQVFNCRPGCAPVRGGIRLVRSLQLCLAYVHPVAMMGNWLASAIQVRQVFSALAQACPSGKVSRKFNSFQLRCEQDEGLSD